VRAHHHFGPEPPSNHEIRPTTTSSITSSVPQNTFHSTITTTTTPTTTPPPTTTPTITPSSTTTPTTIEQPTATPTTTVEQQVTTGKPSKDSNGELKNIQRTIVELAREGRTSEISHLIQFQVDSKSTQEEGLASSVVVMKEKTLPRNSFLDRFGNISFFPKITRKISKITWAIKHMHT
jgi:hypothetical protein